VKNSCSTDAVMPPSTPPMFPPSNPPLNPPCTPPLIPPFSPPVSPPPDPPTKPPSQPPMSPPPKEPPQPPFQPPPYSPHPSPQMPPPPSNPLMRISSSINLIVNNTLKKISKKTTFKTNSKYELVLQTRNDGKRLGIYKNITNEFSEAIGCQSLEYIGNMSYVVDVSPGVYKLCDTALSGLITYYPFVEIDVRKFRISNTSWIAPVLYTCGGVALVSIILYLTIQNIKLRKSTYAKRIIELESLENKLQRIVKKNKLNGN
jgi:hypothetical protein